MRIRNLSQIKNELPPKVAEIFIKFLAACNNGDLKAFNRCKRDYNEVYRNWIEKKYDSQMEQPLNLLTYLCHAPSVTLEHHKIALILIADGIDINSTNSFHKTPLGAVLGYVHKAQYGQKSGCEQIAKTLLERKEIDVNKASLSGNNSCPLHDICQNGSIEFVKLLVQKGAKVEQVNGVLATPFFLACVWGHEDVVRYFLQMKNVKINTAQKDIAGLSIRQALKLSQYKHNRTPQIIKLIDDYDAGRPILDPIPNSAPAGELDILNKMQQRIQHLAGRKTPDFSNKAEKKIAASPKKIPKKRKKSSPMHVENNSNTPTDADLKKKAKDDFTDLMKKLNVIHFSLPSDVKEELSTIDSLPEGNKIKTRWKLDGDKRSKLFNPILAEQKTELASLNEIEKKSTNVNPPTPDQIERARVLLNSLTDQRSLFTKLQAELTTDARTADAFQSKQQKENPLDRIKQTKEASAKEKRAALKAKADKKSRKREAKNVVSEASPQPVQVVDRVGDVTKPAEVNENPPSIPMEQETIEDTFKMRRDAFKAISKKWRKKETKKDLNSIQPIAETPPQVLSEPAPAQVASERLGFDEAAAEERKNELASLQAASAAVGKADDAFKSISEEKLPKIERMPEVIFFKGLRWGIPRLFSNPVNGPSLLDPVSEESFTPKNLSPIGFKKENS